MTKRDGSNVLAVDIYTESGRWRKHPDAVAFEVVVVAGSGGTSSTGRPGTPGEALRDVFLADELPDSVPIFVGAGGQSQFGSPGDGGYVLIVAFSGERPAREVDGRRTRGSEID